jgi:hypothetical protein
MIRGPVAGSGMAVVPSSGTESAWERGLRSAKMVRYRSSMHIVVFCHLSCLYLK